MTGPVRTCTYTNRREQPDDSEGRLNDGDPYYYYYYYYYYLLQLSFQSVAEVLTLVQIKQIRINIHKRNNKKFSAKNTQQSKYKYTYYENTHTVIRIPPHTLTRTLQNKLNNQSTRYVPNEIVTIHPSTLSIRSL